MFRAWAVFYDHFSMEAVGQCLLKVGFVSGWAELGFPVLTAAFWCVAGGLKVLCSEHEFLVLAALRCGWVCVWLCSGQVGDRQRQAATHSLCRSYPGGALSSRPGRWWRLSQESVSLLPLVCVSALVGVGAGQSHPGRIWGWISPCQPRALC